MRTTVRVEGLKELEKSLKALGDEATVAGRRALRREANMLRDALKEAAPYSGDNANTTKYRRLKARKGKRRILAGLVRMTDYGHLRDNIRVREAKARKDHTIVMMVHTGRAFWGSFLEFGTRKMAARPWMRPTFDGMQMGIVEGIKKQLGRQIELAAKRLARRAKSKG